MTAVWRSARPAGPAERGAWLVCLFEEEEQRSSARPCWCPGGLSLGRLPTPTIRGHVKQCNALRTCQCVPDPRHAASVLERDPKSLLRACREFEVGTRFLLLHLPVQVSKLAAATASSLCRCSPAAPAAPSSSPLSHDPAPAPVNIQHPIHINPPAGPSCRDFSCCH